MQPWRRVGEQIAVLVEVAALGRHVAPQGGLNRTGFPRRLQSLRGWSDGEAEIVGSVCT